MWLEAFNRLLIGSARLRDMKSMMGKPLLPLSVLCIGALTFATETTGQPAAPTTARPPIFHAVDIKDADEHLIFSWEGSRCQQYVTPDAPARIFRRADGKLTMYATHFYNWSLEGRSFSDLRTDCHVVLPSPGYESGNIDKLWIEATWSDEQRNVIALVSQDLSGFVEKDGCDSAIAPGHCWLNAITSARSSDMGRTFTMDGAATVASISDSYDLHETNRSGFFTTSNIVNDDGSFYVLVFGQDQFKQPAGNCLFRSRDLGSPSSWKAWDGQDFNLAMSKTRQAPYLPCTIVSPNVLQSEVRSLNYLSKSKMWVAAYLARLKLAGDSEVTSGVYVAYSPDLIHWGNVQRVLSAPTDARLDKTDFFILYPSIIDPASRSANFVTLDSDRVYVTYTKRFIKRTGGPLNRQLNYIETTLEQ
jgi:hypothetical protein